KTIALVNAFVINTTQFLNKFAYLCEEKLANVAQELQRLEITMYILEAKLASIPGLENITVDLPPQPQEDTSVPPPPPPPGAAVQASRSEDFGEASSGEEAPPPPQEESRPKVKDDPRYKQYFNLLRLGAPEGQI